MLSIALYLVNKLSYATDVWSSKQQNVAPTIYIAPQYVAEIFGFLGYRASILDDETFFAFWVTLVASCSCIGVVCLFPLLMQFCNNILCTNIKVSEKKKRIIAEFLHGVLVMLLYPCFFIVIIISYNECLAPNLDYDILVSDTYTPKTKPESKGELSLGNSQANVYFDPININKWQKQMADWKIVNQILRCCGQGDTPSDPLCNVSDVNMPFDPCKPGPGFRAIYFHQNNGHRLCQLCNDYSITDCLPLIKAIVNTVSRLSTLQAQYVCIIGLAMACFLVLYSLMFICFLNHKTQYQAHTGIENDPGSHDSEQGDTLDEIFGNDIQPEEDEDPLSEEDRETNIDSTEDITEIDDNYSNDGNGEGPFQADGKPV